MLLCTVVKKDCEGRPGTRLESSSVYLGVVFATYSILKHRLYQHLWGNLSLANAIVA